MVEQDAKQKVHTHINKTAPSYLAKGRYQSFTEITSKLPVTNTSLDFCFFSWKDNTKKCQI